MNLLSSTLKRTGDDLVLSTAMEYKKDVIQKVLIHFENVPLNYAEKVLYFKRMRQLQVREFIHLIFISTDEKSLTKTLDYNPSHTENLLKIAKKCFKLFCKMTTAEEFAEKFYQKEFEQAQQFEKDKSARYSFEPLVDYIFGISSHVNCTDWVERIQEEKQGLAEKLEKIAHTLTEPIYNIEFQEPKSDTCIQFTANPLLNDPDCLEFKVLCKSDTNQKKFSGVVSFHEGCVLTSFAEEETRVLTPHFDNYFFECLFSICQAKDFNRLILSQKLTQSSHILQFLQRMGIKSGSWIDRSSQILHFVPIGSIENFMNVHSGQLSQAIRKDLFLKS